MSLTLKSLQTEMRGSFGEMSLRISKLDENQNELNGRVDRTMLRLDRYIKENAHAFRSIDERFHAIDKRFHAIDKRFDDLENKIDRRFDGLLDSLHPYFMNLDKMLSDHENRITVLEQKH